MKKIATVLVVILTLTAFAMGGEQKPTIGVSLLALSNPGFKIIGDNIASEAKKNGYNTIVVDANMDASRQSNQIKDFITSGYAAIILSPCDSKAIGPIIREANDAGIPVFTVDIASLDPDAKVISHVASDNYLGGKLAADAMIEALGGLGKIGIIDHPEVESVILRTKGFVDRLMELNKEQDMPVVSILPGSGTRERSYNATLDMLQSHPDISGIFAINDPSALGVCAALEVNSKSSQVVVIGFDGQVEARQMIKEGAIYADAIQYLDEIGRTVVKEFVKYMNGDTVQPVVLVPTGLYRKSDAVNDPELN